MIAVPAHKARSAMRIVREAYEIGVGTDAARRYALDATAALLGAVVRGAVGDMLRELRSPFRRDDVLTLDTPYHHRVAGWLGRSGDIVTATHQQLVPELEWRRSRWMNEHVRPARLAHFLGSHRVMPDGSVEGMGYMRAAGDARFDERDRELLHLLHLGLGRLFPAPSPRDSLAPRARQTLDALLSGASQREAAGLLGISTHRVHDYVKQIYRAFGVSSRAELLALPR